MQPSGSVRFFDDQFQRQLREQDLHLNPFEQLALPYLRDSVLDYGCGLGNLAVAAARRGCSVHALDASPTAIGHLRGVARADGLAIRAEQADLRTHAIGEEYDAVVCIGLLMFFECALAHAQLQSLMAHVRPSGIAVVNVLVEGTTYLGMFDPQGYCLFGRDELKAVFAGWELLHFEQQDFPAPNGAVKCFATVVARKPGSSAG
ncbi:class I SAM-dependent methyltransferase [Ramlibacter sp.]|uniref:class I SAM-dependent methyltransferase n=1 Tax=Ramlibacter sp. TaxID=1917967 RepID=UPI002B52F40B|nr:class I SAM-dependent methyltransferase [Ramlibacter sp.]HWI83621.1 class I SAM-dependent methyltransferase [Ramlibacter sp.]